MTTAEVEDVGGLHCAALTLLQGGVCSPLSDEETPWRGACSGPSPQLAGASGLRGRGEASEASLGRGRGLGAGRPGRQRRRQWAGVPPPSSLKSLAAASRAASLNPSGAERVAAPWRVQGCSPCA